MADRHPRQFFRSALAIVVPVVGAVSVTTATDQVFHSLGVFPPWGQPMPDTDDNLLSLAYRIPYTVIAGYAAARIAPRAPMTHAGMLGVLTIAMTVGGTAAVKSKLGDVGPDWFWITLAATALPCTLLGAWIAVKQGKAAV